MLDDCAPERDGNADGISGPSKGTVVKDGPHAGETTGKVSKEVCFIDTIVPSDDDYKLCMNQNCRTRSSCPFCG